MLDNMGGKQLRFYEQTNTPGSKIEGWAEGKVKEAVQNYMRCRQNAKTLE